jgi:hypothetical protein
MSRMGEGRTYVGRAFALQGARFAAALGGRRGPDTCDGEQLAEQAHRESRGHGRALRRWRSIPLGCLLVGTLLAGLPAVASASAPEMRGEWEIVESFGNEHPRGRALIVEEANSKGEFASNNLLFEGVVHGTFSGTLEGGKASVTVTTQAFGSFPPSEFNSSTMTVESTGSSLSMSGSGVFESGGATAPATVVATRIKTYKEVEEREAREAKEQAEREARQSIRGEWELTLTSGAGVLKGQALIAEAANTKNEFLSNGALFEGAIPGTFSGTLEGANASVKVTTEAYGPFPATEFNSTTMAIASGGGSLSMSGSGTSTLGPATLTATRTRTYAQIEEQEATEKAELEAKEKTEREAKEKAGREAREKLEREAKEKTEREAKEKAEREAKEKLAKEAALKQSVTLVSAEPTTKTFTVTSSGSLALKLTNPNAFPVQGSLTLTMTVTGKASQASAGHKPSKTKTVSLGKASFTISAQARGTVTIKLAHAARAELASHKSLRVTLTIVTNTSGEPSVSKTYSLTLHAPATHHKH